MAIIVFTHMPLGSQNLYQIKSEDIRFESSVTCAFACEYTELVRTNY